MTRFHIINGVTKYNLMTALFADDPGNSVIHLNLLRSDAHAGVPRWETAWVTGATRATSRGVWQIAVSIRDSPCNGEIEPDVFGRVAGWIEIPD